MYQSLPFQYGVERQLKRVMTHSTEVEDLEEGIVWEDVDGRCTHH
jgi:hypothetical protein